MKYRTFRNLVMLGGAAVLASLCGTCLYLANSVQDGRGGVVARASDPRPAGGAGGSGSGARATNSQPQPAPTRAFGSPSAASPAPSQGGPRREDQLILNFLASQPAKTDKVKDAFPRESFKVNFYCDDGGTKWNRLKIDLDRDGRDDEKWELKDGQPAKRRVATLDNEQYDREYRWNNSGWVAKN